MLLIIEAGATIWGLLGLFGEMDIDEVLNNLTLKTTINIL